jgi:predicted ester cyclase
MNKIDIVESAFDLDNRDRYSLYSDDFKRTDEMGSPPIDRSTWIAMQEPLRSAMPDLSVAIEDIREEGGGVVVTSRLSGTFTNDLDLSAMGMGVFAATGKAVDFPSGTDLVSFDGGKISEFHGLDTGPDTGMAGFFKALGAESG